MSDPLRWAPAKRDVLDALADDFLHNYAKGRTLLAVDGPAATAPFADAFAERLGRGGHAVFRASIADFHGPRALRTEMYRDGYDYSLFRRTLVEPFKLGGSTGFQLAGFDAARDMPAESDWKTGPQDATLVVDGQFLNRPELRGLWNFSVWLQGADPVDAEYLGDDPAAAASAIMDDSDPAHPRRVFADSC
jgi:uridine kinase